MENRTVYDRLSGAYDLLADAGESASRDVGVDLLHVHPGERVLELGCGTGRSLVALAVASGPTGRVVGMDLSAGMLAVAARAIGPGSGVSLVRADARALCLPDAAYDAMFMSFTLELFEAIAIPQVLAEVHRALRPGGRLAVVAMAESPDTNAITDLYQWLHRHFPHFVDCRPIAVTALIERAGFRIARVCPTAIWGLAVACVAAIKPDRP